jgi:PRC-barrel domain
MATEESELIGLHAFSRDSTKLGKIKDVIEAGDASYLVIGRLLSKDLLVPSSVAKRSGERVEVPYTGSYLDMAPTRSSKGSGLTRKRRSRLERFYQDRPAA